MLQTQSEQEQLAQLSAQLAHSQAAWLQVAQLQSAQEQTAQESAQLPHRHMSHSS
ncbi:MAG: hypothetical protein WKF57_12040 [Nakamurella sp.]